MCGFMFLEDKTIKKEKFRKEFEKISYRGPDMDHIEETKEGYFGFHRLSIMDVSAKGMQPFFLDDMILTCNGEIYNYKQLEKEIKDYKFESGSDCEVLLPLYKKYGVKIFEKLDAEFALVLFDGKDIIAARDPLGIRPMFYGYTKNKKIAFASEVKSLIDICEEIKPFPIGSYYYKGEFHKYIDLTKTETIETDLDKSLQGIRKYLEKAIYKRLQSDVPLGFLLSGGLDSSLVCSVAAKQIKEPIKTFAIGMEKDAIDLKYAAQVADYIKSDHTEVIISKEDVLNALEEVIYTLETFDITTIRASIGMYLLCKYIKENTDVKVIMTGEVSDELFGYKYTDFAPDEESFQKEAEKRITELYMYDVLRADRCISSNSLEGRVPFGDIDFVKYVMAIAPKLKMNTYNKGKYLLRKAFVEEYLPEEILMREKAAFSDAVGHSLVDYLKEAAEERYTTEEFKTKIEEYNYHSKPFTKESLMYREIFEKYYPKKATLIKDFWMPNKEWVGEEITDPSARVLSNYGDSGK